MKHPPGLIILNKPPEITSFQCLGPVKRALGTKKVGHCGTLDKFASGLMLLLSGRATKLVPRFMGMDKTYRARLCFGSETSTLDPEGEVVARADLPDPERVKEALLNFQGPISQVPPAYSAIHLEGKRAYQLAREGKVPELKARIVEIHSIEVLSLEPEEAELVINCSKGTYIRSLARDIGIAAGTRAHLRGLERLSIGGISLESAVSPEDFDPFQHLVSGPELLDYLPGCLHLEVDNREAEALRAGRLEKALRERAYSLARDRGNVDGFLCYLGPLLIAMLKFDAEIRIDWVVPGMAP